MLSLRFWWYSIAPFLLISCKINDPAQSVSVTSSLSAPEVSAGDPLTIEWSSNLAKGCTITSTSGISKDVDPFGKETFNPTSDETYTVACEPSVKGDKSGAASADVKVVPLAKATVEAKSAQINFGETVELVWSCDAAARAEILANGQSTGSLTLTGSQFYSPAADVEYELTCENRLMTKTTAKTKVTVIQESDIKPVFDTFEALDAAIDISALSADCGLGCLYAAYDKDNFEPESDGSYTATSAYKKAIAKNFEAIPSKVALFTSRTVAWDFSKTIGYGHRAALNDAAQQQKCEQQYPYSEKDKTFLTEPNFLDEIERNKERLPAQDQKELIVYGIEVSTKAIAGQLKAGIEATVSYKVGHTRANIEAGYTDFDRIKGSYRIATDGSIVRALPPNIEAIDSANDSIQPRAYIKIPPADGIEVNSPPIGVPDGSYFPEPTKLGNGNYNPSDPLCRTDKRPFYFKCYEPNQPCSTPYVGSIDAKPGFSKPRSWRVISANSTVQCNQWFPEIAQSLSLGADWIVNTEQQFFVTDGGFPGCGAGCVDKYPRNGENDWRFENIEPAVNRCVNRWAGLNWNTYRDQISNSCTSTQLYKDAASKAQTKAKNDAFANACKGNEVCKQTLLAMVSLADKYSSSSLKDIIDREAAAMQAAKNSGIAYFIQEVKLSPTFTTEGQNLLSTIENGIETVQQLHIANGSSWISANNLVHSRQTISGFDSYQETKNSIPAYKLQLARVAPLVNPDLKSISCNFDSKGRFRKYEMPQIFGDVKLEFDRQNTVKTTVKVDTKLPK